MRTVYIGIREAGLASEFVRYKFRATALPRVLKEGMVIPTALPPCVTSLDRLDSEELDFCKQYYVVDVGPFDVFSATLTRGGRTAEGNNLTMLSPDGLQELSRSLSLSLSRSLSLSLSLSRTATLTLTLTLNLTLTLTLTLTCARSQV